MATDYLFPSSAELREIERVLLPRLTQQRPIFDILPIQNRDAFWLYWEQRGNILGLQQVRGMDGDPRRVKELAAVTKMAEPGVYGEFRNINETDLTMRRNYGSPLGTPINIDDLVRDAQEQLLQRRLDRMEQIGWNLLINGTFTALGEVGQVLHTDTYSIQTYTAGLPWSTSATAMPLGNLRQVQLLSRGISANFGAGGTIYMNRVTFNNMSANTNANDLGGKRAMGLSSITGVPQVNEVLTRDDLPNIVIYDRGYIDDAGNFQLFIPNNKFVLVGRRDSGTPIGEFQVVRNANNPDLGPGFYMKVIDRGPERVPRRIECHDGGNYGPVLTHPEAVVSGSV